MTGLSVVHEGLVTRRELAGLLHVSEKTIQRWERAGMPTLRWLCVGCHLGWHNRRVVLYRDIFRPDEWACVSSAPLLGQNVEAWLDRRYPVRP